MQDDITLIYDEYAEQILFCKYFIANKLKHNAEMGRCGENILIAELNNRFKTVSFVTGFIVVDGIQSTQCDILMCKKSMHERKLDGGLYLVNPKDCLMIIEVKGNLSTTDFSETISKNKSFATNEKTKHIKLALFSYKTSIGKRTLYGEFGYKYNKTTKSYNMKILSEYLALDYFICIHRDSIASDRREKQCLFIKDGLETRYNLSTDFPVTRNFFNLVESILDC